MLEGQHGCSLKAMSRVGTWGRRAVGEASGETEKLGMCMRPEEKVGTRTCMVAKGHEFAREKSRFEENWACMAACLCRHILGLNLVGFGCI